MNIIVPSFTNTARKVTECWKNIIHKLKLPVAAAIAAPNDQWQEKVLHGTVITAAPGGAGA
jgi:hypothetical protein